MKGWLALLGGIGAAALLGGLLVGRGQFGLSKDHPLGTIEAFAKPLAGLASESAEEHVEELGGTYRVVSFSERAGDFIEIAHFAVDPEGGVRGFRGVFLSEPEGKAGPQRPSRMAVFCASLWKEAGGSMEFENIGEEMNRLPEYAKVSRFRNPKLGLEGEWSSVKLDDGVPEMSFGQDTVEIWARPR